MARRRQGRPSRAQCPAAKLRPCSSLDRRPSGRSASFSRMPRNAGHARSEAKRARAPGDHPSALAKAARAQSAGSFFLALRGAVKKIVCVRSGEVFRARVSHCAPPPAARDRARPRCDRRSAAWASGGALLPRLLRRVLLPAAVRLLRRLLLAPSCAWRMKTPQQERSRKSRESRGSMREAMAAGADRRARRLGFFSRRADALVRGARSGLRARPGAQRAPAGGDRRGDGRGASRARADRAARPRFQGLPLPDTQELEPRAPGGRQGRVPTGQGQSALHRHHLYPPTSGQLCRCTRSSTARAAMARAAPCRAEALHREHAPHPAPARHRVPARRHAPFPVPRAPSS